MRFLALAALILFSSVAFSQGYPGKPIRIVLGCPPGGSGDFTTRLIADELGKEPGATIVVENKRGSA